MASKAIGVTAKQEAIHAASPDAQTPGPVIQGGTLQKSWPYAQNEARLGLPFDNLSSNEKGALAFLIRNLAEPDDGGALGWTDLVRRQALTQELDVKGASGVKYVLDTLGQRGYLLRGEQWILGARRGTRYRLNPRLVPQIRAAMRTSSTNPTGAPRVASRVASDEASEAASEVARHVASGVVTAADPREGSRGTTHVVAVLKDQQQPDGEPELILGQLDLSEWEPLGLELSALREFVGAVPTERIQEVLDIIAHNERVLRTTNRRIANPIGLLVKYLRQGGQGPLWAEKGFKPRAQRRAEEESRLAAETEAARHEAELLRFKSALTDPQRAWVRQEAAKLLESRQRENFKIPDRLMAKAFEDAEREVLRERFALKQVGRPVPEA